MTATIAAPALDFVVFYVADLDQSFHFFKEQLGFAHLPEGDGPNFRQFDGGGRGMSFGLALAGAGTPEAGAVGLYLKAADLPALHAAWTAKGIEASPITRLPFGPVFTIATPDGRTLTPFG